MSLGKLTAALASGNQEIQLALASLNFDVSLVKMEAPKEFHPLALALPSKRKTDAEDGPIHATARKLHSLFAGLYTPTPKLYSTYGTRASSISQQSKTKDKITNASGPFIEHIGVEGGSIWAAATSGSTSVAVHLLACMLARVFTAPEAIAAWEEIVTLRKKQILDGTDPTGAENLFAVLAAKTPLSRQDLGEWDASARAWLRIADEAMQSKQKQLLLIINNNKKIPISLHGSTFESIMQAWSKAMVAVEKLIQGMPQSIVDGSVLLALSAWHIYPDMSVLGEKSLFIKQNDDLVAQGGILTLGLESTLAPYGSPFNEGVTWSLPLAYYHYYGGPLITDRSLVTDGSRLTLTQLLLVTAGCLMVGWSESGLTPIQIAEFLSKLSSYIVSPSLHSPYRGKRPSTSSWMALVGKAAQNLIESSGVERDEGARLIAFGRRRCGSFVCIQDGESSIISKLQRSEILLQMLYTADARIRLLRRLACRLPIPAGRLLIRYIPTGSDKSQTIRYGYATIANTALQEAPPHGKPALCRWQYASQAVLEHGERRLDLIEGDVIKAPVKDDLRFFWCNAPSVLQTDGLVDSGVDEFFGPFAEKAIFRSQFDPDNRRRMKGVPYHFLAGDPSSAAVYVSYEPLAKKIYSFQSDEITSSLESGDVDVSQLLAHFTGIASDSKIKSALLLSRHVRSLKAIATVAQVYEPLAGSTIATSIVKSTISESKWLPETNLKASAQHYLAGQRAGQSTTLNMPGNDTEENKVAQLLAFEPLSLDRAATFACIAMMESGNVNIAPIGLDSVMALSSSDSLFVASQLVNDPAHQSNSSITRIQGNIGRSGITMLIPPSQDLYMLDPDDWNQVDHKEFDGELRDSFSGTSLHLSFTDFSLAIDTGKRGGRSTEVQLVETVISVHDRGRRIADLDVLASLDNALLRPISNKSQCSHTSARPVDDEEGEPLVSLDSWYEFIDLPDGAVVFRGHGNWQARLAAATLSVRRGHLTLVFGEHVCWTCGQAERERLRHKKKVTFVV